MGNDRGGPASHEEVLRRSDATEELLGGPKARPDAVEEERRRKAKNEVEREEARAKNDGAWSIGVP